MKLLFRRREFMISFVLGMLLSLGLFLVNCTKQYGLDKVAYLSADKLFIGRSYNNSIFILLEFLLPLIVVMPFADIFISDYKNNTLPCVIARAKPSKYYFGQMLCSGLSAFIVVFIPFIINFALNLIAFPAESVNYSFYALSAPQSPYYALYMDTIQFPEIFIANPYLYNIVFLFLLSAFCSLLAMITYQASYFISGNKVLLLSLPFIINNFLIILTEILPGINISPFAYLFSYDDSYNKSLWYLILIFLIMILFIIVASPKCIKRLSNLR